MNRSILFATAVLVSAAAYTAPALALDVGVSINIGDPGYYGPIRVEEERPRVIYREPVIVERVTVEREPVYMRVPPGHAKHWSKHCHEYDACGQRVYFVEDDWYNTVYVSEYQERHGDGRGHRKGRRGHD